VKYQTKRKGVFCVSDQEHAAAPKNQFFKKYLFFL